MRAPSRCSKCSTSAPAAAARTSASSGRCRRSSARPAACRPSGRAPTRSGWSSPSDSATPTSGFAARISRESWSSSKRTFCSLLTRRCARSSLLVRLASVPKNMPSTSIRIDIETMSSMSVKPASPSSRSSSFAGTESLRQHVGTPAAQILNVLTTKVELPVVTSQIVKVCTPVAQLFWFLDVIVPL